MNHTPGPWRIGKPSVRNGVQIFKDSDWPLRSEVICTMPKCGKGRTANARLIASAPDLLRAAKRILAREAELTTGDAYLEYRALEAAVAKAEGRVEP